MNAREALYQNFDRKVGNPKQFLIHNKNELNRFILTNSGQNDECYASTCFYVNGKPVFDDLFLEEDNRNIKAISTIGQYYDDHDISWVPLYSGNRGFQIHTSFEAEIVSPSTVKKFASTVLKETHNEQTMDDHVTGDLSRLARIPNTQRINGNWCIPLSHEDVLNQIPFSRVFELAKSPQFVNYNITFKPKITEFVNDSKSESSHEVLPKVHLKSPPAFLLKDFIRPCIYEKLCSPNPKHYTRLAATRDALLLGLTSMQLTEAYSTLNWIDFTYHDTKYYIDIIRQNIDDGENYHWGKEKLGCTKKNSCLKCLLGAV